MTSAVTQSEDPRGEFLAEVEVHLEMEDLPVILQMVYHRIDGQQTSPNTVMVVHRFEEPDGTRWIFPHDSIQYMKIKQAKVTPVAVAH